MKTTWRCDLEPSLSSTQTIPMSTYLRHFANIHLLLKSLDCLQIFRFLAAYQGSKAPCLGGVEPSCRLSFLNGKTLNLSTFFHFPSFYHVYFF